MRYPGLPTHTLFSPQRKADSRDMAAPEPARAGSILYALVARGSVVLAEHASVSGNSSVVAVGLLQKVPPEEGFRASWAAGQHIFHILSAGGLTYLCMADEVRAAGAGAPATATCDGRPVPARPALPCPPCLPPPASLCVSRQRKLPLEASLAACLMPPRPPFVLQSLGKRLPFVFLADAQQQFESRYSAVAPGAVAYEMSTEFAPVLRDRMHYFNTDPRWVRGLGGGWGVGGGVFDGAGASGCRRQGPGRRHAQVPRAEARGGRVFCCDWCVQGGHAVAGAWRGGGAEECDGGQHRKGGVGHPEEKKRWGRVGLR